MTNSLNCIHCGRDDSQAPLVVFRYQEQDYWICAEHLPILIHQPDKLAGKLPGAENLPPADHD